MYLTRGCLKPPRWFVEALCRLNYRLSVRFNDQRGRWIIYERGTSGRMWPVRVLEDVENDGAFVPLSMKVLEDLALGDTWRRPQGFQSVVDEIQEHNAQRPSLMKRARDEIIKDVARHVVRQEQKKPIRIDLGRGRN